MNFLIAIALDDGTYQYHIIQAKDEEEAEVIAENFLEEVRFVSYTIESMVLNIKASIQS